MKHAILLLLLLSPGCGQRSGPLRIAVVNATTHFFPSLAQQLGYFQEEGLDVLIETVPSAQKGAEAVLAGSADLATGGFDGFCNSVPPDDRHRWSW
jgi:ABC-type nitrate/sulfonate/bicarbonate transport system substrate-binding protein